MRRAYWLLWVVPLVLGIATAREPASHAGIAPPKRIPDPVIAASPPGTPVTVASIPREVRRAVVADAARRFAVAANAVVLTRAEQVTWNDGSLGCPSPGRVYGQMQVSGYRITATTASAQIVYHTDSRGSVVACAQ